MTTSKDRDKRRVRWINNQSNESMTLDALSDLAEQGFTACNERCPTHRDSPGYPCDCLLDTFPTEKYYELYKEARDFYLQELMRGALARTAHRTKGDLLYEE